MRRKKLSYSKRKRSTVAATNGLDKAENELHNLLLIKPIKKGED